MLCEITLRVPAASTLLAGQVFGKTHPPLNPLIHIARQPILSRKRY
jgi:hypothetical protein